MLQFFILLAWLCEVCGGHLETQKTAEIQSDEGDVNSQSSNLKLVIHGETMLDFSDDYAVEEDFCWNYCERFWKTHKDQKQQSTAKKRRYRNAVSAVWPAVNGDLSLPYKINFDLEDRTAHITEALKMISDKTCIKFHPHTDETDYLHFQTGKGCASYVGCVGGEQPILVGPQCRAGNICHEILHSLGLYHEHSRQDRGKHITILFENIASGRADEFMVKNGNTLGLNYDLESILHYGNNYFSRNGKPTIVPKDSNVKIGQRTHLSDLDVERLRVLYHCDERENRVKRHYDTSQ